MQGISETILTLLYIPGYTAFAARKPVRTKPIKSVIIMHSLHVTEEEFKREQQRVLNFRK